MATINEKITAIADGFRERDGTTALLSLDDMAELAKQGGSGYAEDIPNTSGQWACLARASQMRDIVYQVKAEMTTAFDDNIMQPNRDYTGLIYSSVRGYDWGFIGYPISLYSYLTALNNPKSIVYTKNYKDYFPKGGVNVSNVYGTNCSEYVSYCLNLPYLAVTNTFPILSSMESVCYDETTQTVDTTALRTEMKLCDVPVAVNNHVVIITGIRRDSDGLIQEVDVSDSWPPRIRKKKYSWSDFVQNFITDERYVVYRYKDLESVTFPKNLYDIVYSDIVTNRGDKVSIRPDQDISLNVLGSGYTGIVLFKDGVQVSAQASTGDWELTNLTTGKYTAVLYKNGETVTIDDANETNSTSFIVCAVTVSNSGNAYSFTAEAINGIYPKPMQITLKDNVGGTKQVEFLDIDNFAGSGSVEIIPITTPSLYCLPFKTEYGFVIAEGAY